MLRERRHECPVSVSRKTSFHREWSGRYTSLGLVETLLLYSPRGGGGGRGRV